jgi:lysine 2,3-aminomutase
MRTQLQVVSSEGPRPPKPSVAPEVIQHRSILEGEFWKQIPAYREVSQEQFFDHHWQSKNTITKVPKLLEAIRGLVSDAFFEDASAGFEQSPMAVRVSPYLLSLIDWTLPYEDPLRKQFIPVASRRLPDHPQLRFDSLLEQYDSPVPGLTHRYVDKALFLALDTCPVYCRFCTRSYAVGPASDEVEKVSLKVNPERWKQAFDYIRSRKEIEDVVISGGDAYNLRADQLRLIGDTLLDIPNVRRMRFATKGPAVMPQKLLTDDAWFDALVHVVDRGRKMHKEVVLHTHFNHPNEITFITQLAMNRLFERGVTVRNQSVLQCGVNDRPDTMALLIQRLSYVNVHPYYVYVHDLVKGVEDLRTSLQVALDLEKHVRGRTAGFNTPMFVVDAPGGGGKRDAHSFEAYDRTTGISVYTAPSVKPGQLFCYFDPVRFLPPEGQERWAATEEHARMLDEVTRSIRG